MRWLLLIILTCFSIRVIATEDHSPLMEYGRGLPRNVFWSPDGSAIYVLTTLDTLWRYDASSLIATGPLSAIRQASFSPDGRWLITQTTDAMWSLRPSDDMTHVVQQGFLSVAFSPNGHSIVIEMPDHEREIRSSETLMPATDQPDFSSDLTDIQWSMDSRQLLGLTDGDRIDVLNLADPGLNHSLTLPNRLRYGHIQWSPDGSHLVDWDYVGGARVWNVETGDLILNLPSEQPYLTPEEREAEGITGPFTWFLNWSMNNQRLFRCTDFGEGEPFVRCTIYEVSTGLEVKDIKGGAWWQDFNVGFSPDHRSFILSPYIYDAETGASIADTGEERFGSEYRAWSPNSQRIALSSWEHSDIYIYDVAQHKISQTLHAEPFAYGRGTVAWSPDNRQLVTWGYDKFSEPVDSGLITIWNTDTGVPVAQINAHVLYGDHIAFNDDASRVAASDRFGNAIIFDTATGSPLHWLTGHLQPITQLVWQPHGTLLATSDTTGSLGIFPIGTPLDSHIVYIWDTASGQLIGTLEHDLSVLALSWSPSGDRLITDDGSRLYVWDANTRTSKRMSAFEYGYSYLSILQWSDDGTVFIRGYSACTHTGPAFELYNASTLDQIGSFRCVLGNVYPAWRAKLDRYIYADSSCGYTMSAPPDHDCHIDVRFLADHSGPLVDETTPLFAANEPPDYSFGAYKQTLNTTWSPDKTMYLVVSDIGADLWTLNLERADLKYAFPGVTQAVWSPESQRIALASSEGVRVVDVKTGEAIFKRNGVQSPRWLGSFLVVCQGNPRVEEMWDINTNRLIAAGDTVPTIVSPDGHLGAETHMGVLRLWSLGQ